MIVKVGRPIETPCPEPGEPIRDWLRPGWEEAALEPEIIAKRKIAGEQVRFDDSEDRQDEYDNWMDQRLDWQAKERPGKTLSVNLRT